MKKKTTQTGPGSKSKNLKSAAGGKIPIEKISTRRTTTAISEGRAAYNQASMEGGKVPEKKFKNKTEQTRYMNILSNRIGNGQVSQFEKDAAYKKAISIRKKGSK